MSPAPKPLQQRRPRPLPVISLFSGAFGLDLGLEQAGFEIRVAVEPNRWAADTIEANVASGVVRSPVKVLRSRIEDLSTAEILEAAGLEPGEAMVVSAGPSCQSFSTVGRRRSLDDPRGTLFREFLRVVHEAQPRFFVMEQVRGVLSAAVRHRPRSKRGPGCPSLAPEEQLGSAFRLILGELAASDFYSVFDLINVADYGVGQARHRVLFVGSRDGEDVRVPIRTHADGAEGGRLPWVTLRDALRDLADAAPIHLPLSDAKSKLLKCVPEGGNWRDLPPKLQPEALGRAFVSWGGRGGFYRRLKWDRPAPALTTRPDSRATMFGHPTELRTLSVRESARLQGFPDDYAFSGGPAQQFVQIGNAVPIPIGLVVGEELVQLIGRRKRSRAARKGVVACESSELLERMAARPRTVLNPQRMRSVKGLTPAREWMAELGGERDPLDIPVLPARTAA